MSITTLINFCHSITGVMKTIAEHVKARREALNLSQVQLAKIAGCSQGTIGNLESGIRAQPRKLLDIARALQVSPEWLETGRGPMKSSNASNVEPAPIGMYRVPLISNIQAGMWAEIVDNFQPGDAEEWLLTSTKVSGHSFALKIKGDSMYRADNPESFKEGDVVLIDPDVQPKPGGFVAARNGKQEATFKRYRPRGLNEKGVEYFELVPLNENYPTMRSDLEEITIIGTAVEHRKTL